jgi:sigma-E factor negative regulatory protein RseA
MTVNHTELLSALVDGELQGQELEKALQLLANNEQTREQLKRYQFTSDVLHGNVTGNRQVDLTASVSQALDKEPIYTTRIKEKPKAAVITLPKNIWQQAAGLAMAASVGALAVVGVISQPQNQLVPMITTAENEAPVETSTVAAAGNRWTVGEEEVADRLNTYLVDHNEYAGASGVFSYARVVSYESGQ